MILTRERERDLMKILVVRMRQEFLVTNNYFLRCMDSLLCHIFVIHGKFFDVEFAAGNETDTEGKYLESESLLLLHLFPLFSLKSCCVHFLDSLEK